jgi:uncharacterized protein YcbX
MPHLSQIILYPIKSLDGISVQQAAVLESGALQGDREYAIVDYQGKFVNGKLTAVIHQLRASFNLSDRRVSLRVAGSDQAAEFHLDGDRVPLEGWLGDYFGFPVKLIQNVEMGFPDDTDSPGPTIISTETLKEVTSWFDRLTVDSLRKRMRTTLEIADVEPFWEDQLYAQAGSLVPFQIGTVNFMGVNPCQRCIVPTRDQETGESYSEFQKIFSGQRQKRLPAWVDTSRFNHFYRLAVNTRLTPSQGRRMLQIGDSVQLS